MFEIDEFPVGCRRNIRRLVGQLSTDCHTAYAMLLLTAALMDLRPEDPKVADMVLLDCRVEVTNDEPVYEPLS